MKIKFLLFITVFIFVVACSSSKVVNTSDHKQFEDYKPISIQVVTEDGQEYQFSDSSYSIKNDTLFGEGLNVNDKWIPFEGKIPFDEIKEVKFYSNADAWTYKQSIIEFEQFVKEGERPAAINVTNFDSSKYLFINNNYYLAFDTLYGSGQFFIRKREEFLERKIALTDIVSMQFNFTNKIDISFNYDPTIDSLIFYEDAGSEALVRMNNGKEYNGELLSVNDTIMIMFEKHSDEEEDSSFRFYSFYSIKNREIKLIELKGGNNAIYGIIFGGLMGAGVGAAVNNGKDEKEEESEESFKFIEINTKPVTGCCIGGILGAMIGGIIGFSIPDDEVVYENKNNDQFDFTKLNKYARYGSKEPFICKNLK